MEAGRSLVGSLVYQREVGKSGGGCEKLGSLMDAGKVGKSSVVERSWEV